MQDDLRLKFQYIEDADLWRWALPKSKAFHAGLGEMQLEYDAGKNPGIFDYLHDLPCADIIERVRAWSQCMFALVKPCTLQLHGCA